MYVIVMIIAALAGSLVGSAIVGLLIPFIIDRIDRMGGVE